MLDKKTQLHNIQVEQGYYSRKKYNSLERFISYFYQIDSIARCDNVIKVLEIGPGNKIVTENLRLAGYDVTTCDFDPNVNPDVVADVRNLPFENNSFDCIILCQILEHIPFKDFEKTIEQISRITKKHVIISLPQRSSGFEVVFKIPFIQTIFKRNFFDWSLQFPVKFPGFEESSQHYWEIDWFSTKGKDIEKILKRYFLITKTFRPVLNKYHRFYILKKKQDGGI